MFFHKIKYSSFPEENCCDLKPREPAVCNRNLESNSILDCINKGVASRETVGIVPLCSALRGPVWSIAPRPGVPVKVRCRAIGLGPEEGNEDYQRVGAPLL